MASLSTYLENKIIDWLYRGQAFVPPAILYVALMTTPQSADGSAGVEVAGNAYARVAIAAGLANWAGTQGVGTTAASNGTSGKTSNNAAVAFPTPTGAWGTVQGVAFYDAPAGGNLINYGILSTQQTVGAQNTLSFNPAQLTLTVS